MFFPTWSNKKIQIDVFDYGMYVYRTDQFSSTRRFSPRYITEKKQYIFYWDSRHGSKHFLWAEWIIFSEHDANKICPDAQPLTNEATVQ